MRQLRGKPKENAREKKDRKKDFLANKEKAFTVALPTLAGVFILIAIFIYFNTRPKDF